PTRRFAAPPRSSPTAIAAAARSDGPPAPAVDRRRERGTAGSGGLGPIAAAKARSRPAARIAPAGAAVARSTMTHGSGPRAVRIGAGAADVLGQRRPGSRRRRAAAAAGAPAARLSLDDQLGVAPAGEQLDGGLLPAPG